MRTLKAIIVVLFIINSQYLAAQLICDTLPQNRKAVLETFTSVKCSFCPAGHKLLDSIAGLYPGEVLPVVMHPTNLPSYLLGPYPGNPDLGRPYVNDFFTMPFVHDSIRFMPGAFINRVQWQPQRREQFMDKWLEYTDSIINKPSPLNIGLIAGYDINSNILNINAQVYFTESLNDSLTFYIILTEDSVIAEQNNGGSSYLHYNLFRESFSAQWGDSIHTQYQPGRYWSATYSFNNNLQYNMHRSHVLAYVRNTTNEQIVSGNSCDVDIFVTHGEISESSKPLVYPNPCRDMLLIENTFEGTVFLRNIQGICVMSAEIRKGVANLMDTGNLPPGIYLLNFSVPGSKAIKIIKL